MPAIYYIIKRFFQKYQPIQRQLDDIKYNLEVQKFMQAIQNMPAEERNTRRLPPK